MKRGLTAIGLLIVVGTLSLLSLGCSTDKPMTTTTSALMPAHRELSVTTWNIGYAGLGADSDFFADLGDQSRPPSRASVDRNLAAITSLLAADPADVLLIQEAAAPSWVTWRRDIIGGLRERLAPYEPFFKPDFRTNLVPPPWSVAIGSATVSRVMAGLERVPLSGRHERYWGGLAHREYAVHIARLDGAVAWSVINLHLSAFDEDGLRFQQAREVIALAEKEYAAGRCVILGGDWNMRLTKTDFDHQTEERYQFWLRNLPGDIAPEGWRWGFDPSVATVRTLHQPYTPGVTYSTIVDGFLVSPGVDVLAVTGIDRGFQHSDHNPVRLTARAKDCRE